jgi:hypothetical protein
MIHTTFVLVLAAQQAPPASTAPPPPSASELQDIQRALGADAQATAPAQPPAPPAPTASISMNPDIAAIMDIAGGWFSVQQPRELGHHDPHGRGFTLQQLELSLGKSVDPYFRMDANVVLTEEGAEVEEAYATTLALPFSLQARAGQFLTRFGRLNPTHPHTWDFLDQPFFWTAVFGGDGNRGPGAEVSWLAPLPWYVELVASATDGVGADTARSFYGDMDRGVGSPLDLEWVVACKQFFPLSDALSLMVGASAARGPNPSGEQTDTQLYGGDLYLRYRPTSDASSTIVSLQAEAIYRRREIPGDRLRDHGGYATLLWRFAQRWTVAGRYEYGSAVWNRDGRADNDYLEPLWQGRRQRGTGALTFFPTEFSRLRLQGSVDTIPEEHRRDWGAVLGLEVLIGAHGAHKF